MSDFTVSATARIERLDRDLKGLVMEKISEIVYDLLGDESGIQKPPSYSDAVKALLLIRRIAGKGGAISFLNAALAGFARAGQIASVWEDEVLHSMEEKQKACDEQSLPSKA